MNLLPSFILRQVSRSFATAKTLKSGPLTGDCSTWTTQKAALLCRWVAVTVCVLFTLPLTAVEAGQPERWAILIGIDNYFDLTPLTSSSKDAIQLGEILKERCGFNPKNVSVVVDQPSQLNRKAMLDVRYKTLSARLRNFIDAAEQGDVQTLVVYYSGHGCAVLDSKGDNATDLLLPAIDAAENNGELTNAISRNEIQNLLAKADIPEKLLILDCCHASQPDQIPVAGKAIRLSAGQSSSVRSKSVVESPATDVKSDSNFIVLAGSAFHQVAGEQVFTKHLVDGLSVMGDAVNDADDSQQIEVDELYRHVRASMSAGGSQTPSMKVISGKRDSIAFAPAVVQPDPERIARVYVVSSNGEQLPGASVKLVFSDNEREEWTTLASGETNADGKASLSYHFGTTRDRDGLFRLSVTHGSGLHASELRNISNFTERSSPVDFKIRLSSKRENYQPPSRPKVSRVPTKAEKRSVLVSPRTVPEPTFQEVLKAVTDHVRNTPKIPDVCSFQKYLPEYNRIMKELKRSDKLRLSGTVICFPSSATWDRNHKFRASVIRVLTSEGILNTQLVAEKRNFAGRPEPSFDVVKAAAFSFVEQIDADVCGLVEYVNGYKELIDSLSKAEKFEVLPGLAICFPSKATWERKRNFRRDLVRVLRESHVLDK